MKRWKIIVGLFVLAIFGGIIQNALANTILTLGPWFYTTYTPTSSVITTRTTSTQVQISELGANVPCIGTNASSILDNGTCSGGSGSGNLFVTPTSSVLANNVVAFKTAASSTVDATTSIYAFNDGDVSINTSTDNGLFNLVNASGTPVIRASSSTNATSSSATIILGNPSSSPATPVNVWLMYGDGHMESTGTTPTLSSCGTSPTSTGQTDSGGEITVGSVSATTCTDTFQVPYESTAGLSCWVTSQTGTIVPSYTYTNTALTITNASLTGDKLNWGCNLYGSP